MPGVFSPPVAHAAEAPGRLCSGTQASGSFSTPSDTASFKLFVPSGATVVVNGSADIVGRDTTGGWQTIFYVDPVDWDMLGHYYGGPYYNQAFSWSWVNTGPSGDIPITVRQQYGTSVNGALP